MDSTSPPQPAGFDAEFEALLVSFVEPAYRLALRLTNDPQDAEDLVQDAALRAYRFRASFTPGTSFKAWFYRILVNNFYTTVKKKRPATSLDGLSDAHELFLYNQATGAVLARGVDPVASTVSQMATEDVAAALEALPHEFRAVCTLYFMEDLSYQEIAEILGIPVGTVRSRIHRGRRMLQKRLWQIASELGIVAGVRAPAALPVSTPSAGRPPLAREA